MEFNNELCSNEDIHDALFVLKNISNEYKLSWSKEQMTFAFEYALANATLEDIPVNELQIHYDWGRRPASNTPIIVAQFTDDNIVILDGQHRVIVAREKGKRTIEAFVLKLPVSLLSNIKYRKS